MEGKPVDFDKGDLNPGTTICIFTNLDNTWKTAIVQEIDLSERELLVDFSDGAQEWISFDGRKICYPPEESQELKISIEPSKRRSSSKLEKNELVTKKTRNNFDDSAVKRTSVTDHSCKRIPASLKSLRKRSSASSNSKKAISSRQSKMSKGQSQSGLSAVKSSTFLRLKFKSNEKPSKGNLRGESRKRRRGPDEESSERESSVSTNTAYESIQRRNEIDFIALKKNEEKANHIMSKGTKKEMTKLKVKIRKNESKTTAIRPGGGNSDTVDNSKRRRSSIRDSTSENNPSKEKIEPNLFTLAQEKKIKTLLPKRCIADNCTKMIVSISTTSPETLTSSSIIDNATPLSCSSRYICPKQDCKKQFRNENLLMMHIKHYHPEYRNILSSMPNVADLAYARTIGEHIESPQGSFLERIAKLEEDRLKDSDHFNALECCSSQEEISLEKNKSPVLSESNEKISEQSTKPMKSGNKKTTMNKRLSCSEPSSPKVSVLVAQLQEPPLVPPPFSIEETDAELSVSQVSSPQYSDNSNSIIDLEEKQNDTKKSSVKKRRLSQLESTDVINCLCGYGLEDGLMVQCDLCQCWQHGACVGFENEVDVPLNYTCETCLFPKRCHQSRRYLYVQNWLREGIMPKFRFSNTASEVCRKRSEFLKSVHQFLCDLAELRNAVLGLQIKIQILRQIPDHPKLYLWAKSWNNNVQEKKENQAIVNIGPVPEDAINMAECRKHLSEHIDGELKKADIILKRIENGIEKMEEVDASDETDDEDSFTKNPEKYVSVAKQTLLMMLRDLTNVQNLKYCDR